MREGASGTHQILEDRSPSEGLRIPGGLTFLDFPEVGVQEL